MKKKIITLTLCLLIILSVCFVPDVDAGTPTLNLTNSTYYIEVGKSFAIKLNGLKASKVKWSSSNKSVATVSKKGVVKGIKKGTATITGKYKKIKFKVKITVTGKNNVKHTFKDLTIEYKGSEMTNYLGDDCWAITFKFTNKSADAASFDDEVEAETFINNKSVSADYIDNDDVYIKNGASVNVTLYYKVESGDKIEFKIFPYDDGEDYVLYETEYIVK